jgi:hypothetical protein
VLYASQKDVLRVVAQMDARYRRDTRVVMHNPDNDMDYVKDSEHYWVANNCNHLTARCLREMRCDVRGLIVLSGFSVEPTKGGVIELPIRTASTPSTLPTARAE